MRRLATILLALTFATSLGSSASALATAASLPDIEDEVMCTICGTTLQLSNAPQAERERVFINELIAEGKSKEQIKAALVDEYGPEVLAVPGDDGFDLLGGWIFPAVAVLAGAAAVAVAALRWRRDQREDDDDPAPTADLSPDDQRRLDKDLGRYDT